jgi:ribose transport system substrate-binding protein
MSRFTRSIALVCLLAGSSPSLRAEEDLFYALCPKSLNNPFWEDVRRGMKEAAEELGVRAEFVAPVETDATQQVQKIEALLGKKVDGIAISPNVPDSIIDVVAKARVKGIPVICFDADSPESERLCYVGTFNEQAGFESGKLMKKHLPEGGKILVVSGGAGALNHNQRVAGFKRGIKGSKIEIDAIKYCNDDLNRATQLIESYVAANPDLDAIFCTATWAICAGNVRRDSNLKIPVVGFDTVEEELQLIKDGHIDAVVGQRPEMMGYEAVMTLHRLRQAGEKMEEVADDIDTGTVVVTRKNVVEFAKKKGCKLK